MCPIQTISIRRLSWPTDVSSDLALAVNEIQVWTQSLSRTAEEVDFFRGLLSPDELERAGRFRFDENRREYIVARGTLRSLLAAYLCRPARDLTFVYSEYGRPSLMAESSAGTLNFNIAHSGNLVLLAFAYGRRVGIDVERVRRNFVTSEIAERFFSAAEREALRQLPEEERHEAFFRCWTRKEAFIKALGEGLSHPLHQFDVTLTPAAPAQLLATRPDASEVKRWMLWDIPLPGDYLAALAAESEQASA